MLRRRFNYIGLFAAILLATCTSLLLSGEDGVIDGIETIRAVLQAGVAVAAFLTNNQT
ncbi:hypothetical protein BH18ACI1_BH18ACI1_14290 [soil metagenome]